MADIAKLKELVGDLDEDAVNKILNEVVAGKPSAADAQKVVAMCQEGMEIVGSRFEKSEYFVGDLIFAGELLTGCIDKLKPFLGEGSGGNKGVVVLGTVEGDIHDIGKNIFKGMLEAAGFKVVDIGIDQKPDAFVKAAKENNSKIVGLSGVLTLSIDSMKRTVEALKAAGLNAKVIIGGNAVNEEACKHVGASAWSKNAAEAVKTCAAWV